MRNGNTHSCGCLNSKLAAKRAASRSGVDSPMYIHGRDCGLNKKIQNDFHESIRKRDNYTCQKCGKTQEQELIEMHQKLSVHHKDGNHFHNVDENATTLCASCHMKIPTGLSKKRDQEVLTAVYKVVDSYDEQRKGK